MAADKMIFMKKWYDAIVSDDVEETTPEEMAYILYAAMQYCFNDERINIGDVFGREFRGLNRAMPNIYSQIDAIQNFGTKNIKYDAKAIKDLASQGYSVKQICEKLGYPEEKSRSLYKNPGYIEGKAIYDSN